MTVGKTARVEKKGMTVGNTARSENGGMTVEAQQELKMEACL